MAKSRKTTEDDPIPTAVVGRQRLRKLLIRNFRSIGQDPVEVDLDDIVVLVGSNNAGKSTILRAYELVMSDADLKLQDFPNGEIDPDHLPEIELHIEVSDNPPGEEWISRADGTMLIKEKWKWEKPGKCNRVGFNVMEQSWDTGKVPYGAQNVAKGARPKPHAVYAFSDPADTSSKLVDLLMKLLKSSVASESVQALLEQLKDLQKQNAQQLEAEVSEVESKINSMLQSVFPGYEVKFNANEEEATDNQILPFRSAGQLLMGPTDGHKTSIDNQGSGAQRTLLWAVLRAIAESEKLSDHRDNRPHLLLIDEPEICLHPSAVREACEVLYQLPQLGNWQVMITTHCPVFIDLHRDNTSIVRVERSEGLVKGTTLYRPQTVSLDEDDRAELKLLNLFDPYVAEFFFGGRVLIVEGDTEYTAFQYAASQYRDQFAGLQIIRARGKATIVSLIKILNHFGSPYSVLHDSDHPTVQTKANTTQVNGAWTINKNVKQAILLAPDPTKITHLTSIPYFEQALLGVEPKGSKPYFTLESIQQDLEALERCVALLKRLLDPAQATPSGFVSWENLEELQSHHNEWLVRARPTTA